MKLAFNISGNGQIYSGVYMSDYAEGQKAYFNDELSWSEVEKKPRLFKAGYNNAAKLYQNGKPKIIIKSKLQKHEEKELVICANCETRFHIDEFLFDECFIENGRCLNCDAVIPVTFGDKKIS